MRTSPSGSQPTQSGARNDAQILHIRNEIIKSRNVRASLVDQRNRIMRQRDSLALIQSTLEQLNRSYDADLKSYQLLREKLQEAKYSSRMIAMTDRFGSSNRHTLRRRPLKNWPSSSWPCRPSSD